MSTLAVFCRGNEKFNVTLGVGEVVGGTASNGLLILADGTVAGVSNGEIDHYSNGLPFNLHGRLVMGDGVPDYYHNGVTFSANGAVGAEAAAATRTENGIPRTATNQVAI